MPVGGEFFLAVFVSSPVCRAANAGWAGVILVIFVPLCGLADSRNGHRRSVVGIGAAGTVAMLVFHHGRFNYFRAIGHHPLFARGGLDLVIRSPASQG